MEKEIKSLDEKINKDINLLEKNDNLLKVKFVKTSIQNLQEELKKEINLMMNKKEDENDVAIWGEEVKIKIDKAFLKHIGKGLLK